MMLLPKKIGPFTLMRRLGNDAVTEAYVGILDEPAGKQVVVRRILPYVVRDAARMASIEARIHDLSGIRHPSLISVLDFVTVGDDRFIIEEWVGGLDLGQILAWLRAHNTRLPHHIYLSIATQVCNGIEALHGRPGKSSGAEHVLHLALQPSAIVVGPNGKVKLGGFGLVRSPTALPHGGVAGTAPAPLEYLSPEQTHPDQQLTPASDVFALGTLLFELATLGSLFKAPSNLQTIHAVRRAEVTAQLLLVKEVLAGLDKVLYRALSLNPRHRYQRAFVLREDLRGLMAGFSFKTIDQDTVRFLEPLLATRPDDDAMRAAFESASSSAAPESTGAILRSSLGAGLSSEPDTTDSASAPDLETTLGFLHPNAPSTTAAGTPIPPEGMQGYSGAGAPESTLTETTIGSGAQTTWVEPSPFVGNDGQVAAADETGWVRREPPADVPDELPEDDLELDLGGFDSDEVDWTSEDEWRPNRSKLPLIFGLGLAAVVVFAVGAMGLATVASVSMRAGSDAPPASAPPASAPAVISTAPSKQPRPSTPPEDEPDETNEEAPNAMPAAQLPPPSQTSSAPPSSPRPVTPSQSAPPPQSSIQTAPMVHDDFGPSSTELVADDEALPAAIAPLMAKSMQGQLTSDERADLQSRALGDPEYTDAYTLLYQDARARQNAGEQRAYLDKLLADPQNQYKSALLVEQAMLDVNEGRFDAALGYATRAEQHSYRLPSHMQFSRRAKIYEAKALAWQGKFNNSAGDDIDALRQAVSAWERYQEHVNQKKRTDLARRAAGQIAKLNDAKRRLE